ncbi:MAG: monovalent cation/H+ antiporter subunit D family protein, partial [Pseudomonadota bacterium]
IEVVLGLAPDSLLRHAPVLLVVVPLVIAGISSLMPNGRTAWFLSIIATAISAVCAIILLGQLQSGESDFISYAVGGWAPPIGIEFRVDALNILFLLLVTLIGFLASVFSWPTVAAEVRQEKRALFYAAYLICFAGLAGVAITGDAFNLFVFLEISSISTYVLVALGGNRDRRAFPAAFNYLIMGTIGATFFVIGVGFLYAATGTLNMVDIAARLSDQGTSRTVQAAFAFIAVGLGLKAAAWPLHQWLPNAYAYAPSFVTMFLSATATKVAIYALIRFLFTVFNTNIFNPGTDFIFLFAPLAMAAMLICSFQAIFQNDVRRMLAYSSVAQVGYILLGISIGSEAGVSAGLFHLVNHALLKGALFMAVAGVVLRYQGTRISDFAGLGRAAPLTMTAFAIAGFSLIGMPLTAGFQSKWLLLQAMIAQGWGAAAIVIVGASILAVIYIGRVLQAVFFLPPANPRKVRQEAPLILLVPLWIMTLATLWFGIQSGGILSLTDAAANTVASSLEAAS